MVWFFRGILPAEGLLASWGALHPCFKTHAFLPNLQYNPIGDKVFACRYLETSNVVYIVNFFQG